MSDTTTVRPVLRLRAALAACLTVLAATGAVVSLRPAPVHAAEDGGAPYWVSLRNSLTNMRVGPGRDYRINWVYVRAGVPLKVLRQMEGWVLVEDSEGARGWMLTQFVARKAHTGIVKGGIAEIRENKDGSGALLWRAAPGVIARIGDCSAGWCKVDIDGRQGYVRQDAVWGAGAP
ncbi:SH3 domain-containing protein [Novosphingobium nitrogenifigens]|uniref:SH3 domain-containing protein n=1 Tax=Novosphingobium nitrogenifigens TaxID=378548 RepID=UPI0003666EED|nr:SH3 domain-containing protein [Novosphingobium nitrogenifigens]